MFSLTLSPFHQSGVRTRSPRHGAYISPWSHNGSPRRHRGPDRYWHLTATERCPALWNIHDDLISSNANPLRFCFIVVNSDSFLNLVPWCAINTITIRFLLQRLYPQHQLLTLKLSINTMPRVPGTPSLLVLRCTLGFMPYLHFLVYLYVCGKPLTAKGFTISPLNKPSWMSFNDSELLNIICLLLLRCSICKKKRQQQYRHVHTDSTESKARPRSVIAVDLRGLEPFYLIFIRVELVPGHCQADITLLCWLYCGWR